MKRNVSIKTPPVVMAVAMAAAMAATTAKAATPLEAQIVPRPVTPGNVSAYKLPASTEVSGGLSTVGIGTPVYLEAEVNIDVPASDITGVTWTLTGKPVGSAAALTDSPLGPDVPVYEPADRLIYQVAGSTGRTLLRPDMAGQYTVTATVTTASNGSATVTKTITAGTYKGLYTCALCHTGTEAENKVDTWQTTAHSMIFSNGICGYLGHYSQSCLACHTVGYDTTPSSTNDGGFYAVMQQTGWLFPAVQDPTNWAAMPSKLRNLGNIQCENCHGPGSEHASLFGDTNAPAWPALSVTTSSGDCNQCHDAPTHHVKGTEWYNSMHAITTRHPSGPGEESCVGCHTADGFIARISGGPTNTAYSAIGCQACHEPHGETVPADNPHLLRTLAAVRLKDGTVVTNAGEAALCMNCHQSRQNATNYVETTSGSSHFGPHHGPQTDMLLGVNGITYDKTIPSSAHRSSVANSCVTCHMQPTAVGDAAFLLAGGHTFNVKYTSGTTNIEMLAACQQCHGGITSFDFPRQDYDGDGVIEGVQTEVQHLLDQLAVLLPPAGQPKSELAMDSTWTKQQLRAAYNYEFVSSDGSRGVHNAAYAVGLLKASIADLTGNSTYTGPISASDLQFYEWQVQNFGSASNPDAAANASPAGDGVPNWLKYSLGLDPMVAGITTTNAAGGIVWADGGTLGSSSATNIVQIYTAAEVAFNTEVGKTYQIQSISSISGGWQNVGPVIQGNGEAYSYTTPTRQNVQQFYRVLISP